MIMVKSVSRIIMKEMELKSLSDLLPLKNSTTQILLSISIFSLVFSWCSSILLHYQNLHLSSFAANKNCIFLICNGILVFVANSSAAVRPPSASDVSDMLQKKIGDGLLLQTSAQTEAEEKKEEEEEEEDDNEEEEEEVVLSDKHIVLDDTSQSTEYDDEEEGGGENVPEEMHREIEHSSPEDQVEKKDADRNESRDSRHFDDDDREEEEEEVDEIEKLSTEELNQRFEDFIRRMKEEFRVNDYEKQQLVMVK